MKPEVNSAAASATAPDPATGILLGGMRINAGTYSDTTERIVGWARQSEPRYVCVANVHMVMEAHDSPGFRDVVNGSDWVTSDGVPLVWVLRRRGFPAAERVYGPTLMLWLCRAAAEQGLPIGLFGGTPEILEILCRNLLRQHPQLKIAARIAPPFGAFSTEQNDRYVRELHESGAKIVFVGLGCPKQERWMAEHSPRLPAVLIGVGAAFNFHAGQVRQSPAWMQRMGLEWLFRFAMEPKRLWRRYLWHNPRFIWLVATGRRAASNRPRS